MNQDLVTSAPPPKDTEIGEVNEASSRIKKRAQDTYTKFLMLFSFNDNPDSNESISRHFDTIIKDHVKYVKEIAKHPYDSFKEMQNRLIEYGPTASFSKEFKGPVYKLVEAIFRDESNIELIKKNNVLQNLIKLLIHSLLSIQIKNRYYYPYKATILVIEEMLRIVDILSRLKKPDMPDYYHTLRYKTYLTYLLDDSFEKNIIFPTCYDTGATFINKTRCVPIHFLAVNIEESLGDFFINSPLEFFYHDVQHSRRLMQENQRYYDIVIKHQNYYISRSPFTLISMDTFYKEMETFTKELYKTDGPLGKKFDTELEKALQQIKKMIVFEVVHEKGWPITKYSLCRNISIGHDYFPVEIFDIKNDISSTNYEEVSLVDEQYKDPTTLSNLYNKLIHGFFDDPDNPHLIILDPQYRNPKYFAMAALELLNEVKCIKQTSLGQLMKLTLDEAGASEFKQHTKLIKTSQEFTLNDEEQKQMDNFKVPQMNYWKLDSEDPDYPIITPTLSNEILAKQKYLKYKKKYLRGGSSIPINISEEEYITAITLLKQFYGNQRNYGVRHLIPVGNKINNLWLGRESYDTTMWFIQLDSIIIPIQINNFNTDWNYKLFQEKLQDAITKRTSSTI